MRLLALLLATSLFAADAPKAKAPAAPKPPEPPVYLTETEAAAVNTDYKLQGEYANAKMGANVIALGKDEFRLVLFKGGLPGAPAPVVIAKDQIKTRVLSPNSLMPEGLLNGLEEPDVRSLFLYLRQTSEPK